MAKDTFSTLALETRRSRFVGRQVVERLFVGGLPRQPAQGVASAACVVAGTRGISECVAMLKTNYPTHGRRSVPVLLLLLLLLVLSWQPARSDTSDASVVRNSAAGLASPASYGSSTKRRVDTPMT